MKSSGQKEESADKKRYVFFSDPDIIAKRAETSAIAAQITQELQMQQQTFEEQSADLRAPAIGTKSLENLLFYHPVQPYPFTFISAVKQKLTLEDFTDINTKAHGSISQVKNSLTSSVLKANSTQNLNAQNQIVAKMSVIKPLKVPDLKISPKTLDFSSRENSASKELSSTKSEIGTKEFALDRSDKSLRTGERVQRKLDFSDGSSFINCESIELLKVPNISITSNLSKKKEHVRDNSREKENKSKRMKKDDSSCAKRDESMQDQVKRSRSPRHIPRKDASDMSNVRLPKNDRPFHATKSNDFSLVKSKDKNFVASTAKRDNDKRQRFFNAQSMELTRDNLLESKIRISSNESPAFPSWKVLDKVTLRDNNMGILSNNDNKSKDISHYSVKLKSEIEDLKHKSDLDNRQLKQDKSNIIYKEQTKRVSDKNKMLNNKGEDKLHSTNSEPSEDGFMSETNSSLSKNRTSAYLVNSTQPSRSKDLETVIESKQNMNPARSTLSSKISENFKYTEHSAAHSASTSIKKDEESCSQSIIITKETTTTDNSNDVDIHTLPEALFDPRRISLRDGYSQPEFHNLYTPEKMNLMFGSKRRRYLMPNSDSEVDARCPKYKPIMKSEKEEEIQLIHPTALHMQFQAELHLYDSYNESLRQVMNVEKSLQNTKCEMQEQKNSQKAGEKDEENIVQIGEDCTAVAVDNNAVEKTTWNSVDYIRKDIAEPWKSSNEAHFSRENYIPNVESSYGFNYRKCNKTAVKMAEVQTQTVNDIATQTDISADERNAQNRLSEIHENMYEPFLRENEVPQLSLDSAEHIEDLDQIEEISPSRIRTMSEISLHETTSSIKTETGTEISISTRGVTCSFNQYIGSKLARLLRDENQLSHQIEELFKFQEKTLNDKTKKLAQLEEQKRALRDTGQDSRSVKKKQRALLLKLQQEKDEIYRLKSLYEITSQERKRMLKKQKDMFNPQMSTKNILTKLKRSADSQSPRRLSGPMKGYDIRSNSSMSSLIDSDKSQLDTRPQASESDVSKLDLMKSNVFISLVEESNISAARLNDLAESKEQEKSPAQVQKKSDISKYELRSRKYEEKMPGADILRQKQNQLDMESKRIQGHPMKINIRLLENQDQIKVSQSSRPVTDVSYLHVLPGYVKSESDTLVEELSKRSRTSQVTNPSIQTATIAKEKNSTSNVVTANSESIEEEINTIVQDTFSKTTQSQISEISQTNTSKSSKKIDKSITNDRDISKKLQHNAELKTSSKRKSSKYQKTKSSSSILTENVLRSNSSSHISEELIKHHDKRTKVENEVLQLDNNKENSILDELDFNESQMSLQALVKHSKAVKNKSSKLSSDIINESKENRSTQASNRKFENGESLSRNEWDTQNASTSQISTFAVSHHSSGESEKNFSKSIVVRSQDRDFEQILNARETALASRKNCVEEWMAWHARLRAEEDRVIRMEQAAFKLVAAASNVLCQQDTTVSSDTSDVEGRIGLLTEKLAERRLEMAHLKREAKKQAKKQLRALEANLLNQIKKYDTTIHEMRKKLESKKAIKETDKLAIEPKSLADFKVPEIPLKKIQDIYKSSDLLRSRSESDLLSMKNQQKDLLKIVTPIVYDDKYDRDSSQSPFKSTKSTDVKNANTLELKGTTGHNDSTRTILGDYTSTEAYDKIRTASSVASISNDTRSGKYVLSMEKQIGESTAAEMKWTSISHDVEDAETDPSTVRTELEVQTISDARLKDRSTIDTQSTESTDNRLITNINQSQPKTLTMPSEIQEIRNYSKFIPSKSESPTENVARVTVTDSSILTYSRKLDFLQLNNKNLSEDISSIEKDIKALEEIMSRLSNESNEKYKVDNDERNTSQDISEIISKSVFSDKINDIENAQEEKQAVLPEREIDTESLSMSINNRRSISPNDLSHDRYTSDKINSEISAIPEEDPTISNSPSIEMDYEAKSKEIMNEIEKSVLSRHINIGSDDYNPTSVLGSGNEELLNDLISELGIKSISEVLSKVSESEKSLDLAKNTATQIIDDSKKNINDQSDLSETKLEKDLVKDQAEEARSLAEHFSTKSVHSPIIAGHRSKETISQGDSRSTPSLISSQSSHVPVGEDLKSLRNVSELEGRIGSLDNVRILKNLDEDIQAEMLDSTINSMTLASNADKNRSRIISAGNISQDKDDWTTSDSFQVPQDEISTGVRKECENSRSSLDHIDDATNKFSEKSVSRVDDTTDQEAENNLTSNADVSAFLPKGESIDVAVITQDISFNNSLVQSHVIKNNDELDDILDIIARENNKKESSLVNESEKLDNVISDSMAELLDKVKDIVENDGESVDSRFKGLLCHIDISVDNQTEAVSDASILNNKAQSDTNVEDISESNIVSVNICKDNKSNNHEDTIDTDLLRAVDEADDEAAINVNLYVEIDNKESPRETVSEVQEIIITELNSSSAEDNVLSELEIDAKVELAEEEESTTYNVNMYKNECAVEGNKGVTSVEIKECLETISEQDSSDGEQLDNLVEVSVSGLDTVEKFITSSRDSPKSVIDDAISMTWIERAEEDTTDNKIKKNNETTISDAPVIEIINKTFDVLKDPEYEDISEESLEVSEILDKDDLPTVNGAKKSANLPERYRITQKSEDILRILDEISQKSLSHSVSNSQNNERNAQSAPSATEEISEVLGAEVSAKDDPSSSRENRITTNKLEEESYEVDETRGRFQEGEKLQDKRLVEVSDADSLSEKRSKIPLELDEHNADDKSSEIIYELRQRVSQLQEQNGSSESSEAGDTPRGVSEIEMDSPRDFNDSRLDMDILDDDLLSGTKETNQSIDMETNFHSTSIVATSDKDIESMIDELKASLEQPGLELAELEAKLLRIEQLQIELEIKKLEAEEVSYYVREIPNKPPPPYTPPGDGRLSTSLGSPSLVTAVIPSNVEELTSFTEKATALIYNAKLAGEDIASLEAPPELYELIKDKSETVKRDRRIYNTFLFDLCKETIVEVYRAEYEKPGPSWTKPNVKTKPTMKIPKNVEELIEYVNKEVATLFGFKTKLQRENMVMRWSRKRRDRVDELLAREAQAEEDEWTKFHHDELAVKNGLTVAILDTLVMETTNVVKIAYGKKRRMMV